MKMKFLVCPKCGDIIESDNDISLIICNECGTRSIIDDNNNIIPLRNTITYSRNINIEKNNKKSDNTVIKPIIGILLGIIIMFATFAFITVAWAAYSSTLTIGGTATVKSLKWSIYYKFAAVDTTTTTASNAIIDSIDSSALSISSLGAEYDTPGEKAVYNFTIKNDSNFNAKLASYVEPTITCQASKGGYSYTPTTGLAAYQAVTNGDYSKVDSAAKVCAFITYEYVIASSGFSGTKMSPSPAAGTNFNTLVNKFVFDSVDTKGGDSDVDLVLTLYFDKSMTMNANALPTEEVTVKLADLKTSFVQA